MKQQIKKLVRYSKIAAALSLSWSAIAFIQPVQALEFSEEDGWQEVTIDFEEFVKNNGDVRNLDPGRVIKNQWRNQYGLEITATNSGSSSGYAVIFDSDCEEFTNGDCSGGDEDLATGIGNVAGSNLNTEGNILIIQENPNSGIAKTNRHGATTKFTTPDDDARGGTISFDLDLNRLKESLKSTLGDVEFDVETRWGNVRFIDIDKNPNAEKVSISANGGTAKTVKQLAEEMYENGMDPVLFAGKGTNYVNGSGDALPELKDNSVLDLDISELILNEDAEELDVNFKGSGAIASLSFYYRHDVYRDSVPVPTPAAILPVLTGLFGVAAKRKQDDSQDESAS